MTCRLGGKSAPRAMIAAVLLLMACQDSSQMTTTNVMLPVRAAFYYPWFPETWTVNGATVVHQPSLGFYESSDQSVIDKHIRALDYAKVQVAIASWWGPDTHDEGVRLRSLLNRTQALEVPLKWALYYEKEGSGNPDVSELRSDLAYIRENYLGSNYAVVAGKPVIFVYSADDADCNVAERWEAAAADWYVSLKVFPGYRSCTDQPDAWHQYRPAVAVDRQTDYSYSISPGFWRADEVSPRLARDHSRWRQNIRDMIEADDPWQLVTTFNEWGEGTAVEEAREWESDGYGFYLDALAIDGSETLPRSSGSGLTVVAVGDIACDPSSSSFNGGSGTENNCHHQAVADLIERIEADAFLPLGDLQYEDGTLEKFLASYDAAFGRYKSITFPAVGNHEYLTSGAKGYFGYFGARAKESSRGYYSFNLGTWHLIALNTNCSQIEGCGAGSPQERWLRADLAAHPNKCTLAFMHHPRFSSGPHGDDPELEALWSALYDYGAELVLAGHDHIYERFAPQTPSGLADTANGIRQFVIGTGGKNHTKLAPTKPNSEVRKSDTYGVLKLSLYSGKYRWAFRPESTTTTHFKDVGHENCH